MKKISSFCSPRQIGDNPNPKTMIFISLLGKHQSLWGTCFNVKYITWDTENSDFKCMHKIYSWPIYC